MEIVTETETKVGLDEAHPSTSAETAAGVADLERVTDKWKRALADAENARKRAAAAEAEGREKGIAAVVEALAPALDALALGIEAARAEPDVDDPRIAAHLDGLRNVRAAFETGLKALGVHILAPEEVPFDPKLHEAMGSLESADVAPGRVLVLHRPGFALGRRLIRPARVTVSAAPAPGEG